MKANLGDSSLHTLQPDDSNARGRGIFTVNFRLLSLSGAFAVPVRAVTLPVLWYRHLPFGSRARLPGKELAGLTEPTWRANTPMLTGRACGVYLVFCLEPLWAIHQEKACPHALQLCCCKNRLQHRCKPAITNRVKHFTPKAETVNLALPPVSGKVGKIITLHPCGFTGFY